MGTTGEKTHVTHLRAAFLASGVGLAALLVYLNALHNPFLYDDVTSVVNNASIRNLANLKAVFLGNLFRPVLNASYAVDYALWGLRPVGYHLTSVLLHVANVLLLFYLTYRLADDCRRFGIGMFAVARPAFAAFSVSAIFAVHPMMTEAVGYVSGRSDVLYGFFFLIAFASLRLWWTSGRRAWLVVGIVAWVLALGSKESSGMLPFVLLAYDRFVLAGRDADAHRRVSRLLLALVPLVLAAGAVRIAVHATVEAHAHTHVVWGNALADLGIIRRYVSMLFIPTGQAIFHTERAVKSLLDIQAMMNLEWVLAFACIAYLLRGREPLIVVGVAWFMLTLVPGAVLLFLNVGDPMAEHRVYAASMGLFLAVGVGIVHGLEWLRATRRALLRVAVAVTAVLILLSFASVTVARNRLWHDPVLVWQEAVRDSPDIWLPYRGLGDAYRDRGDCRSAVETYSLAIDLNPSEAGTYLATGGCLADLGRPAEADRAFVEALRRDPHSSQAFLGRAIVAERGGDHQAAKGFLARAMTEDPSGVIAPRILAGINEGEGDWAGALRLCRDLQARAPGPEIDECIRRNQARLSQTR